MLSVKRIALLLLLALSVAACGTTKIITIIQPASPQQQVSVKVANASNAAATTKAQASLPCPPPPGEGVMGACTAKPVQVYGTHAGAKIAPVKVDPPASIPDVSSWQGNVNWQDVKNWQVAHHFTPAGIFKMGEYVLDPFAARNNSELKRLGMWRAGYWFLRNTGCAHEAGQIVDEARFLGLKVVFLDDEVPEARGLDGCIAPVVKRAGFIVGEYASPGAYPGGARSSNPAWIAAYGPATPPAAPWGGPIKAFQCTDGVFGCVTNIPGVGRIDMSQNFGVTQLGSARPVSSGSRHYERFASPTGGGLKGGPFRSPWGELNERALVQSYDAKRPHWQRWHRALVNLRVKLAWLAWRIATYTHGSAYWRHGRYGELVSRGRSARLCRSWNACL